MPPVRTTSSRLLQALETLDEKGHDCLPHSLPSDRRLPRHASNRLNEAAQYYVNLHLMGYGVDFVDCGGGLRSIPDGARPATKFRVITAFGICPATASQYTYVDAADRTLFHIRNIITEAEEACRRTTPSLSSTYWKRLPCRRCPKFEARRQTISW